MHFVSIAWFPLRISMSDCGTIYMDLFCIISTSGTSFNIYYLPLPIKKNMTFQFSISEFFIWSFRKLSVLGIVLLGLGLMVV